eukprot:Seg1709.3 transcript_id=Seg1709.3/GoldUCD/mRNA.D3Y31 product="ADAM 17-like protease" protein_id=Seg1709.3/GoldUCD/D3Y31
MAQLRPSTLYRNAAIILVITMCFDTVFSASYSRTLTEILRNYDTLKKDHIRHRVVRRSLGGVVTTEKEIRFHALHKEFDLKLVPDESIFSNDFAAVLVRDDEEIEIPLDKDNFMTGYLEGITGSKVQAHLEDGILMANIETKEDIFVVEASSRHVNGPHDFDMIVYKLSDVKANLSNPDANHDSNHPSICGVKDHGRDHEHPHDFHSLHEEQEKERRERRARRSVTTDASKTYDTCQLVLVADHLFFEHMGQRKSSTAINYMLSVIQRVDQIYRKVQWPSGLRNIGFEVRRVIVHDKPSGTKGPAYNQYKSKSWDEEELLRAFSRGYWRDFCLAHLFTYQDFPNGVIGVAYVGSPKLIGLGGICSIAYKGSTGTMSFLNSGLSSSMNWGRRLLTSEADVVTAHGHNFGSNHDPSSRECSPGNSKGGKFMMYSTSVSGLRPNNKKFSPCSERSIDDVLVKKRKECFKSKVGQYCGNNEVEANVKDPSKSERCDPGLDAKLNDTDKCCTSNCQFRGAAVCSDVNTPCCDNCQFAKKTKKCRDSFPLACQGETYCNGSSAHCPDAPPLSGVPCAFSKGMCFKGKCLTLCEQNKMVSCLCSKADQVCKICCKKANTTSAACNPIIVNATNFNINDGVPCPIGELSGSCLQGTCKKTQKDFSQHLLNLLKDFTASKFARFMQENIVMTVLVFSLLIWIPASCVVRYVDKRREREEIEEMEWKDINNADLIRKLSQKKKKQDVFKSPQQKQSPRRHTGQRPRTGRSLAFAD